MKPDCVIQMEPLAVRAKDAPKLLGVTRNFFNQVFRPHLTEVHDGPKVVLYDVAEIKQLWNDYKQRKGVKSCAEKAGAASGLSGAGAPGTSPAPCSAGVLENQLAQLRGRTRKLN